MLTDRGGRLHGEITVGFSDVVTCTADERTTPRGEGRIALHQVCVGGSDHEYDGTTDCTLERIPGGGIRSTDCWDLPIEMTPQDS